MASLQMHVFGKDQAVGRFTAVVTKLPAAVLQTMKSEMVRVADWARANKLSGDPLHRRSGDLSRSVTGDASMSGRQITGITGTKGIPYAGIHEYGAVFDRQITMVFGRPVKSPITATFHYPERAFMRPSATANVDHVRDALRATAVGVLNET